MADIFKELSSKIKGKNVSLVFPEGEDIRILQAASRLKTDDLVEPILLGDDQEIASIAKSENIDINDLKIINPATYDQSEMQAMVDKLVERRNGKTDAETAAKLLLDVNYFGTMMVYMNLADGMVSGATHPTGDTVRPALQIIKTAPGMNRISGAFIMQKDDTRYVFADAAINIDIDAQTMADIAIQSSATAEVFGIKPKIAMLSFSTKGSAKHELVDKVSQATQLVHETQPDLEVDGELQFDAAIVPEVGKAKAPDSKVAGQANVFIFPSLEAGNIGYKIAQRLGGFEAIGPILQGLAKPVSDLSRGSNQEDIYKVSIITAAQATAQK